MALKLCTENTKQKRAQKKSAAYARLKWLKEFFFVSLNLWLFEESISIHKMQCFFFIYLKFRFFFLLFFSSSFLCFFKVYFHPLFVFFPFLFSVHARQTNHMRSKFFSHFHYDEIKQKCINSGLFRFRGKSTVLVNARVLRSKE